MSSRRLTAQEIAVVLGVSESAVRHIVRRHGVGHWGKRGKAKLYDPREVIRHAGGHDRILQGRKRLSRAKVTENP